MGNTVSDKKKFYRNRPRGLSIFYDAFGFAAICCALFLFFVPIAYPGKLAAPGPVVHTVGCFALVLCVRFLFRVYHMVLRHGNPGIVARILLSDLIGGGAYILLSHLLPAAHCLWIPRMLSVILVLALTFFSVLWRSVYYYLFLAAKEETRFGKFCWGLLRSFAMVDARTEKNGEILRIDELRGRVDLSRADPINDVQRIARQFQIVGEIIDIAQITKGYINRTYRVRTLSVHNNVHSYTLQRINTNVFPDVDGLMENFELVTKHLHEKMLLPGHTERGSIQMLKYTKDGKSYFRDDSGCWRMLTHFTEVYGMDIPDSPETFYYAGQSFGTFVRCMADVPVEKIHVVIPNFHNTYSRYLELEEAIKADPVGRLSEVWDEVGFVRERKDKFGMISDALESGKIPTRICHNDCNLNNILFSKKTHLPVAIIDLDTVMPGSPLYDYGDSMRIGTNTAKDDEKDLEKVQFDLGLYAQYARGYLEACGKMLTKEELELLPVASLIITSEDGIRFLADYINGDVYYNVFYPNQNLDRARTQLKLLADMEKKEMGIRRALEKIYKDLGLQADPYRIPF